MSIIPFPFIEEMGDGSPVVRAICSKSSVFNNKTKEKTESLMARKCFMV